jgi:hypothetical protein
LLDSELRARSQSLNEWLVYLSKETGVKELVHGIVLTGLFQKLKVFADRIHRIGAYCPRGCSTRCSDSREARISASQQSIDWGLQVGKGERKNVLQ